jgi:hypothetical protein
MSVSNRVLLPVDVVLHSLEKFAELQMHATVSLEVVSLADAK